MFTAIEIWLIFVFLFVFYKLAELNSSIFFFFLRILGIFYVVNHVVCELLLLLLLFSG